MSKKNILREAIEDSKNLKEAALGSAKALLFESMKAELKEFVDGQLNEEGEKEVTLDTGAGDDTLHVDVADEHNISEEEVEEEKHDMKEELELGEAGVEEGLECPDEGSEGELSDDDLEEALNLALQEVDHGDLGEPEEIDEPRGKHDTGLADEDKKAAGWDTKTAPAQKDWTMKESQYKAKIASLVKEVTLLKKANGKLAEANKETNLFNSKLLYATKVVQKEGLSRDIKLRVVQTIDKAKSIDEAKNLYESFEAVLGVVSKGNSGAKKIAPKAPALAEALGSSMSGKGVSEVKTPHLGGDAEFTNEEIKRAQKLAGILSE